MFMLLISLDSRLHTKVKLLGHHFISIPGLKLPFKMFSIITFMILTISNPSFQVLYVQNPVRNRTTGVPVLNVQMNSVEVSKRIRDMYSGFFRRNRPAQLPQGFKGVSVRNKVTLATRIRIAILQELGSNFKESNPGSSIHVRGYESRPLLTTAPARGSPGRPRTYTFISAVTTLPPVFSDEALANIFQKVGQHHQGELREYFVVLDDDDRDRCSALVQAKQRARNLPSTAPRSSSGPGPSAPATFAAAFSSSGAGMELEAGFLSSLRAPPPPPPGSPPSSPSRGKVAGRDKSPTQKRRRSKSRSRSRSRSPKAVKSGKASKSKSKKSHKSRRGKSKRSEKRGFKRNRHTPPPGEKHRKKAKHYSSSSSSSDGTESSGSGSDSDASESSGSGHHSRKPNESPEH